MIMWKAMGTLQQRLVARLNIWNYTSKHMSISPQK